MISQLKKLNYVIVCLLIGILLTGTACGASSKEDKSSKEKLGLLRKHFSENAYPEFKELLQKVDDPSVSVEQYKEMIKKCEKSLNERDENLPGEEGREPREQSKKPRGSYRGEDKENSGEEHEGNGANDQQGEDGEQEGTEEVSEEEVKHILGKIKGLSKDDLGKLTNKLSSTPLGNTLMVLVTNLNQEIALKDLKEFLKNNPEFKKDILPAIEKL